MVAVEWKEPPASAFMSDRDRLVAALQTRPGAWARIQKGMKSKTGVGKWKALGLEVVPAPAESDPKLWDIYARAPEPQQKSAVAKETAPAPAAAPKVKAPLVTQKVTKARPEVEEPAPDPDAAAEVARAWRGRLGHGRG